MAFLSDLKSNLSINTIDCAFRIFTESDLFSPHPLLTTVVHTTILSCLGYCISLLSHLATFAHYLLQLSLHTEANLLKMFVKSCHFSVKDILRIKSRISAMAYTTLYNFSPMEYKLCEEGVIIFAHWYFHRVLHSAQYDCRWSISM